MSLNNRARSDSIAVAARALVEARGVDVTEQVQVRLLAKELKAQTDCHYDTAKRHITKAVRLRHGEMTTQWGGTRPGAGRPIVSNNEDI